MALSVAERQAAYRLQQRAAGTDGDRRLNTWLSATASRALDRLARHNDITKREMLERLIGNEDQHVLSGLDPEHREWNEYFGVTFNPADRKVAK
jgi:hypothetical protein